MFEHTHSYGGGVEHVNAGVCVAYARVCACVRVSALASTLGKPVTVGMMTTVQDYRVPFGYRGWQVVWRYTVDANDGTKSHRHTRAPMPPLMQHTLAHRHTRTALEASM